MPGVPDKATITKAVDAMLDKHRAELEKQTLTKKNVRRLVEQHLGLERKLLDQPTAKGHVEVAIQEYIDRMEDGSSDDGGRKRSRSASEEEYDPRDRRSNGSSAKKQKRA